MTRYTHTSSPDQWLALFKVVRQIADIKGYSLTGCNGDGLRILGADGDAENSAMLRYIRAQINLVLDILDNNGRLTSEFTMWPHRLQAPTTTYDPESDFSPHLFFKPGIGRAPLADLEKKVVDIVQPVPDLELVPIYLYLREYLPTKREKHHTHLVRYRNLDTDTRLSDILPDFYTPMEPRAPGIFGCASCDPSMEIMNRIRCKVNSLANEQIGVARIDKIVEFWSDRVWSYQSAQRVLEEIVGDTGGERNTERLDRMRGTWWKNDGRFDVPPPERALVVRAKTVLRELKAQGPRAQKTEPGAPSTSAAGTERQRTRWQERCEKQRGAILTKIDEEYFRTDVEEETEEDEDIDDYIVPDHYSPAASEVGCEDHEEEGSTAGDEGENDGVPANYDGKDDDHGFHTDNKDTDDDDEDQSYTILPPFTIPVSYVTTHSVPASNVIEPPSRSRSADSDVDIRLVEALTSLVDHNGPARTTATNKRQRPSYRDPDSDDDSPVVPVPSGKRQRQHNGGASPASVA